MSITCWSGCNEPSCQIICIDISGVTGGGVGGRGKSAPQRLLTRKFLLAYREKRGKEKRGENREKKKENCKTKGGKLKMEGEKVTNWGEDFFFFFFFFFCIFFFIFCFSLFKITKFVLGLPKWKFSTGKKIMKNDFAPSEKFSCYAPDRHLPSIMQYLYEFVSDSWLKSSYAGNVWQSGGGGAFKFFLVGMCGPDFRTWGACERINCN